ncbi:uracil-DNA glycosylase [Shouchella patagoniensis]|uniref:uracil-DNA glycosylase n=1 Tax=Shouchella patagoniensis TaxID=228576 RepID=UPI000995BDEC|nr:uracil-DNA glycosylase [Shouchella patagoniensis]
MDVLENDWINVVGNEFTKPYYLELREFLKKEYANETVYPHMNDLFNALHLTSYSDTKVVILGQDPYHGAGQAHGLSFSVQPDVAIPPSLRNVYKELEADVGCLKPDHGFLVSWAKQGVLLLNTVLSVREKQPGSHQGKGWENFTNEVIDRLNEREKPLVFVLWGKHAQVKRDRINETRHCIIESPHPSPFSAHRGFFGSKPFSKINNWLKTHGVEQINWQLPMKAELGVDDDK